MMQNDIEKILAHSDIALVLKEVNEKTEDVTGMIVILLRDDNMDYLTTEMSDAEAVYTLEAVKNQILRGV